MVAFPFSGGVSYGWEAGAGELGVVRLSTGGVYGSAETADPDQAPASATPERAVHYLALEPLGLSIGFDWTRHGTGFMGGVWGGWFFNTGDDFGKPPDSPSPFRIDIDCGDPAQQYDLLGSAALGVRYLGGQWEVYLTPKLVGVRCVELGS